MQKYGIDCLLKDAVQILATADSKDGGCGCGGLSLDDCERLHAIHDELVGLDCDDFVMLGQIAEHLLPCLEKEVH